MRVQNAQLILYFEGFYCIRIYKMYMIVSSSMVNVGRDIKIMDIHVYITLLR